MGHIQKNVPHTTPCGFAARRMAQGLTLIETIVYITILALIIVSFVSFALSSGTVQNKSFVIGEVHANARMALETIRQEIRSADGVNVSSSVFDSDPGVLYLVKFQAEDDPTIIDLESDDGRLRIVRSTSTPRTFMVTSSEIKVTNLQFTNLTGTNKQENIQVRMTLEFSSGATTSRDFLYSKDIQFTTNVRN